MHVIIEDMYSIIYKQKVIYISPIISILIATIVQCNNELRLKKIVSIVARKYVRKFNKVRKCPKMK